MKIGDMGMIKSEKKEINKIILPATIILFAVFSVSCFLLTMISNDLAANVLYADSFLLMAIDIVSVIIETVAVAVLYATLVIVVYKYGKSAAWRALGVFLAATAYKNTAIVIVEWINNGSIPKDWLEGLADIIYFTSLELVVIWIIYQLTSRVILRYTTRRDMMLKVSEKTGENVDISEPYPFSKLYAKDNCLLRSAFICALVSLIAELAITVANDLLLILSSGAPERTETWIAMGINYLSKVILGVITYFVIFAFTVIMFEGKEKKSA